MSANRLAKPSKLHRRFFYHYNKHQQRMTVHWRGSCLLVDEIVCHTAAETKTSDTQPKYVLQGWATMVNLESDETGKITAVIE
tara:strand:+ start:2009 stop:2257 length:249 start_codon:yes stop_codon:yes gene_type:complete